MSKQIIEKVVNPDWENWTPLFIFGKHLTIKIQYFYFSFFNIICNLFTLANKKSGNNDGTLIISHFRRLLNPIQVYDIIDCPPEKALVWLKYTHIESVYVLVAGGDGSIAGVLNSIHNLQLKVLKYCTFLF